MAATSLTTHRWASDLVINLLTSLCSNIFVPPICLAPTASCAANTHNKEEWNAGITNMTVREEDVHDRHHVYQGHVSAYLVTPSAVDCESFAGQLCLLTALTHGCFASSLCLCLCLCLSLSLYLCHTASDNAILIWPRSSPDGTRAPLHTACTTTDPTHTSRPAAESTKDAHCHLAVLLQRSTPYRGTSSPKLNAPSTEG